MARLVWMPAIQDVSDASSEEHANQALAVMRSQDGFLGGRVLSPSAGKLTWRVQTFFETDERSAPAWLPDGLRWVLVPPSLQRQCGFPGA